MLARDIVEALTFGRCTTHTTKSDLCEVVWCFEENSLFALFRVDAAGVRGFLPGDAEWEGVRCVDVPAARRFAREALDSVPS